MKIERFKATDSNQVRLTLGMSYNDVEEINAFRPRALEVRDEEKPASPAEFYLTLSDSLTKVGEKGLRIKRPENEEDMDKPVQIIANLTGMKEPSLIGLLSNQKSNIDIIEKQVTKAKEDLAAAKETIEEV